jgi:hypothetical protein
MDPFDSLAEYYRLADEVAATSSREQLIEAGKMLALMCAAYQDRFGDLPMEGMLDFLAAESLSADQAALVARGLETYVGILGNLHGPAGDETAH